MIASETNNNMMKLIQALVAVAACVFALPASAQIAKSLADCEKVIGKPIKIHQSSPPSRLYFHGGLHVQVSYEGGKAIAIVYRLVGPTGGMKLSADRVKKVYALNGIAPTDIVEMDFPEFKELRGFYKRTKDRKTIILNDKVKNVLAVYHAESLLRQLRKGR